jgi:hypothetical protein
MGKEKAAKLVGQLKEDIEADILTKAKRYGGRS